MEIAITGLDVKYTPSWETLEKLVRETVCRPGRLVRISRRDKGANYTAKGTYDVDYIPYSGGDAIEIVLKVGW